MRSSPNIAVLSDTFDNRGRNKALNGSSANRDIHFSTLGNKFQEALTNIHDFIIQTGGGV